MIQKYVLNHSIENDERSMAKNLWMFIAHYSILFLILFKYFVAVATTQKSLTYKPVRIPPLGFTNLDKYNFQQLVIK